MSSILDKHLISLQGKIDERVETGLTKAQKSLTVRFNAAQEQTGKRIDDVAEQASALSKRLDNNQATRIQKTKDTNLEQENKVSRKFETVANEMDLRFQKVEKKTNTVSDKITALVGRVTNLEKASKLGTVLAEDGERHSSIDYDKTASTFKYIRDYVHSQQDRGSGQRHALRQPPTVGWGMQAVAENGEEEAARPPAAAHEHVSNQRRTSFYAEARGGAALDGRAYANAEEEESNEIFEGVLEPSICLNAYFIEKWPDPVPGVKKEGKMCKAGDLKETEMWHGHHTMQQVNHANLKHMGIFQFAQRARRGGHRRW